MHSYQDNDTGATVTLPQPIETYTATTEASAHWQKAHWNEPRGCEVQVEAMPTGWYVVRLTCLATSDEVFIPRMPNA